VCDGFIGNRMLEHYVRQSLFLLEEGASPQQVDRALADFGMAMGIFVSRWISRLKADKHPAFAIHWLYWHLPASPMTAMRATPPSHIRRMVG